METYTLLRQFADSWMLLALVLIFLGVIVWVFRPGSRTVHDEAARSNFAHDTKPAEAERPRTAAKEARK
jgi:cytochrome c oxidase cbb3-type subunit 4